ncbi:MAG: potassium channel family protein, partial [Gammaproteobacteria bacterium]|nr:potassium channel family protein [Gammaproteobacteria bacterium]
HIALVQGINFGLCIGLFYSVFIRDWLLPILNILNILLDYMRAMFLPMSAFFVGYFLIILTFTGIYGTLSLIDITAFKGINLPWKFSEYVYYSIVSITTLGTANIKAYSELAKIMTSIEVLMGLMWTTVVLAATIAYLQKTFSKLAEKHSLFGNRWK